MLSSLNYRKDKDTIAFELRTLQQSSIEMETDEAEEMLHERQLL